jgi:uncharacterized membrane protein YvlD (DUF360 family)
MSGLLGLLIAIAIVAVPSVLIIWIVSRLNLGLKVDGFGTSFIVGLLVSIVAGTVNFLLSIAGMQDTVGLKGGIIHLILSFIILLTGAKFIPGLKVTGYLGTLLASIAIGAFYWLGGLALGAIIQ